MNQRNNVFFNLYVFISSKQDLVLCPNVLNTLLIFRECTRLTTEMALVPFLQESCLVLSELQVSVPTLLESFF